MHTPRHQCITTGPTPTKSATRALALRFSTYPLKGGEPSPLRLLDTVTVGLVGLVVGGMVLGLGHLVLRGMENH
jgi:hypothetical protein